MKYEYLSEANAIRPTDGGPLTKVIGNRVKEWEGRRDLEEGKDFELKTTETTVPKTFALPIEPTPTPVKDEEGGYYYDLFKFFADNHGLTLIDSEIEDIIRAVEEFEENKRIEAQRQADYELEEDDEWESDPDETCSACGYNDGNHMKGCPEDDSPFALLCRRGFD